MTKDKQIAIRLSSELLRRLDARREQLKEYNPGFSVSRADVVRSYVESGLQLVEVPDPPKVVN